MFQIDFSHFEPFQVLCNNNYFFKSDLLMRWIYFWCVLLANFNGNLSGFLISDIFNGFFIGILTDFDGYYFFSDSDQKKICWIWAGRKLRVTIITSDIIFVLVCILWNVPRNSPFYMIAVSLSVCLSIISISALFLDPTLDYRKKQNDVPGMPPEFLIVKSSYL